MSILNLIYGKCGTGKSEYIYKDIDKKINQFKNIYIIVPEQSNLTSEKKFFEITNRKSLFNVEVLTLSRMAYRIQNELDNKNECLSKQGKAMIIYDLLVKNKKSLNFLGKSEKNVETVEKMFTELKKHNISLNDLDNVNSDDKYTELKLNDIKILYEQYQNKISEKFIDENDTLTILARKYFKNKNV